MDGFERTATVRSPSHKFLSAYQFQSYGHFALRLIAFKNNPFFPSINYVQDAELSSRARLQFSCGIFVIGQKLLEMFEAVHAGWVDGC